MNCAQRHRLASGGCVFVTTRAVFATASFAGLFLWLSWLWVILGWGVCTSVDQSVDHVDQR